MKKLKHFILLMALAAPAGAVITSVVTFPGGSNKSVQYNNNGTFGGEAAFTYDPLTDLLTVSTITAGRITVTTMTITSLTAASFTVSSMTASTFTLTGQDNGVLMLVGASSQAVTNAVSLSTQVTGALSLSTQTTGTISLSTQTNGTISLSTQTNGLLNLATQSTGAIVLTNQTSGKLALNLLQSSGSFVLSGATIAYTSAFSSGTVTDTSTRTFQQGEFSGSRNDNSTVTWISAGNNGTRNDASTTTFTGGGFSGTRNDNSTTTANGAVINGTVIHNSSDTFTADIGLVSINNTFIGYGRNRIINGDMRYNQRYVTSTQTVNATGGAYGMDRFFFNGENADGVVIVHREATVLPTGFNFAAKITVNTADASIGSSQDYVYGQGIEGNMMKDFGFGAAGAKTTTVSFWVRSSTAGVFSGSYRNGAGTRSYPFTYTINAQNTYEFKSITIPGDTSGTWTTDTSLGLIITFDLGVGSTLRGPAGSWSANNYEGVSGATSFIANVNATFYLTGLQVEISSAPTMFEFRPEAVELFLCRRYYEKSYIVDTSSAGATTTVGNYYNAVQVGATTTESAKIPFLVEKRIAPTIRTWDLLGTLGNWKWYSTVGTPTNRASSVDGNGSLTGFSIFQTAALEYLNIGNWDANSDF